MRRLGRDREYRRAEARYIVEGSTLILEAIDAGLDVIQVLFPDSVDLHEFLKVIQSAGIRSSVVSEQTFKKLATTQSPQPVIAEVACHEHKITDLYAKQGTVLLLVGVSDPGNTGTLIRSAEAFGVTGVVIVDGVDVYNPKTVRAAAGSMFRLPVVLFDKSEVIESTLSVFRETGYKILATKPKGGISPEQISQNQPLLVVLGSESHGLSETLIADCDSVVSLPMVDSGESLNVAIAGSVLLYVLSTSLKSVAIN